MTGPILLALLPVILLIALGTWLRHRAFLAESFWPQAERLGYFILLPSLFLHGLATARLQDLPVWSLAGVLIGSTVTVAALVVAARPFMRVDGAAFTSVFQGSVRFNNYVGVTVAAGLFGAQGIALAAICNAAIVPTVNILCVLVFAQFGRARLNARGIARPNWAAGRGRWPGARCRRGWSPPSARWAWHRYRLASSASAPRWISARRAPGSARWRRRPP
jgi:malonate transporter